MVLRLDPRYPLVWRTPTSVQLGVDPPVVILEALTEAQERMLAALVVGVSESGLAMLSRTQESEQRHLLAALTPVLSRERTAAASPAVAVCGTDALAEAIAELLAESGATVERPADLSTDGSTPQLAIATGHYVLEPALHAHWLRRDIAHLPVVLSDSGVSVGPIVEPGEGPCLLCLELHHRDADPAWPAVATQLLGRRSPIESQLLVTEAASLASRIALLRVSAGIRCPSAVRIDAATGARSSHEPAVHPECGCRGLEAVSAGSAGPELAEKAARLPRSAPGLRAAR